MAEEKNKGGRPWLTEQQKMQRKKYLLRKIEPYLMSGLSISRALREAKIFNSEFYKYMDEDRLFGEKIEKYKQFTSVLLNQAIFQQLVSIVEKQNGNKLEGIPPQELSKEDIQFLMWFALHNNLTSEEYGSSDSISIFDPEEEVQKVKRIIHEAIIM